MGRCRLRRRRRYQIAQNAGFDHITIFVNREPVLLPLE